MKKNKKKETVAFSKLEIYINQFIIFEIKLWKCTLRNSVENRCVSIFTVILKSYLNYICYKYQWFTTQNRTFGGRSKLLWLNGLNIYLLFAEVLLIKLEQLCIYFINYSHMFLKTYFEIYSCKTKINEKNKKIKHPTGMWKRILKIQSIL